MISASRELPSVQAGTPPRARLHVVDAGSSESPLTTARIRAGLTVTELAEAVHVSRPTASRWERNQRAVARYHWPMLASALRLTESPGCRTIQRLPWVAP